jgi:hypothetical protein
MRLARELEEKIKSLKNSEEASALAKEVSLAAAEGKISDGEYIALFHLLVETTDKLGILIGQPSDF